MKRIVPTDKILSALEEIHGDVFRRRTKLREAAVARHNANTHVIHVYFDAGDYVLVERTILELGPTLSVRWDGPCRVLRPFSDVTFQL